ncbi:MAG: LysE family translocator [Gammaproteobacteria bacterium]|nr:LysE family translocator [Gammaproteobacteria bacterium]
MTTEVYFAYLVTVAIFFAMPPGPSQALMIANSMRHGVRRSTSTIFGDLTANALQMTAAAFGLAVVISTSYWVLLAVKWAGVLYLFWIGWRTFISRSTMSGSESVVSPRKLWRQGFITSASNPKAIFFFAALFPQFIDASQAIWPQLIILGATYLLIDGILLLLWGCLAERLSARIKGIGTRLNRISGSLMMTAAALLAAKDVEVSRSGAR